jgi:cytidylate kinase
VAYSVICISGTDGAAGEQIAPLIARRLGFRLVNEQIVAGAAREAGVDEQFVADAETRKSLVSRVLSAISASDMAGASALGAMPVMSEATPASDALRGLIRSTIEQIGEQGDSVIFAHAASFALGDKPQVLRVLITGAPEERAKRVAESQGCEAREAEKLVSRGDANRADYIKRFYGIAAESPSDYDLMVNTDRLSAEQAAATIVHAATL